MNFNSAALTLELKQFANRLGFQLAGIAPAARPDTLPHLQRWLALSYHGEMEYMERRRAAYEHPQHVQQGVRSVIMLGAAYDPPGRPVNVAREPRIAAYAQGTSDYHSVLRTQAGKLAEFIREQAPQSRTRIAIDTAPLLERDFARKSGLGWFGKNTMLINKHIGSYFFLAALLTDLELTPDPPHESQHCGTCTKCLDICPTNALPAPYVLDARRCISYLTIELRDQPIPEDLRTGVGEWVFGCDLCQEVCPWNRKAPATEMEAFSHLAVWRNVRLSDWFLMPPAELTAMLQGSPLTRQGRAGLLRNAAIVLGNLADANSVPALVSGLAELDPLVQEAASWALLQIGTPEALSAVHAWSLRVSG